MKNPINLMVTSAMAIFFFALASILTPSTAEAKWRDGSDNLPGMHEFPTGLVVLTAAVAVGAVTYLIVKKNKNDKKLPAAPQSKPQDDSDASSDSASTTSVEPAETRIAVDNQLKPYSSKLDLYFDVQNDAYSTPVRNAAPKLSYLTFKVGLTLGF